MICDRVVVKECIKIWFGNQEAFETCLHSEVLDTLSSKLRYGFFTKKYCLAMTMPILWAFMDISASWAAHAWWDFSVEWLLAGLTVSHFGQKILILLTFCPPAFSVLKCCST